MLREASWAQNTSRGKLEVSGIKQVQQKYWIAK